MKKYLSILAAAAIALPVLCLTACSDDNDGPKDPETPETPATSGADAVDPAQVFPAGVPAQVGNETITTDAEGRVTKIAGEGQTVTFEYNTAAPSKAGIPADYDVKMTVSWFGDDDQQVFFCTLNANGFITYAYEVDLEDGEYDIQSADEWWFTYNADGQMTEMKRTEGGETTSMTYTDGNITKVVEVDEDGDRDTYTIAYTDDTVKTAIENKGGVMLFDDTFNIDMDEMAAAYYAGLLGKATKSLPVVLTDEEYGDKTTFAWTLNADGLPTKMTATQVSEWGNWSDDTTFRW